MDAELRTITDDEAVAYLRTVERTFGESLGDDDPLDALLTSLERDRALVAVEDGRWIGTSGAFSLHLTLPGGAVVPMAGVTAVGVQATHRRRGVLRSMMGWLVDQARDRGEPVAGLLASEAPIYGRFGFGVATEQRSITLRCDETGFRHLDLGGSIELVDLNEERCEDLLVAAFERSRLSRAGQVSRPAGWLGIARHAADSGSDGAGPKELAVSRDDDGAVDGFARYRIKPIWTGMYSESTVVAEDVVAATPTARLRLHRYLCSVDLTSSVTLGRADPSDPTPWALIDERDHRTTSRTDWLHVRILDVAEALEARDYQASGRIVFEITGEGPEAGRWELSAEEGKGRCARTGSSPEMVMALDSLGSLLLGGVRPSTLAAAGRIEAADPGALQVADRVFPTAEPPWCQTMF